MRVPTADPDFCYDAAWPTVGWRTSLALSRLFAGGSKRAAAAAKAPADTRVYAVGDIHGCLEQLKALQERILQDAAKSRAERKVVVYLGDYVDRGPESRGVIDHLIEQPLEGFKSVHLMGNHEQFMLDFLRDSDVMRIWLLNGGDETLRSFDVNPFTGGPDGLQNALRDALTAKEQKFLRGLRLSHTEGSYHFVHAGVKPGVALDAQDPHDLLWIRDEFLSSKEDFGKIIVHGHSPRSKPEQPANRINIDTGAVYGGPLTAVALEAGKRHFLQV